MSKGKPLKKAAAAVGLAMAGVQHGMKAKEREASSPVEAKAAQADCYRLESHHAHQLDAMALAFLKNPDRARAAVMGESLGMVQRRKARERKQ